MNLQAIRSRFSVFLKQFRIEDLKLLMKFLNEIVNEYKNSKAARLFDLLSRQDGTNVNGIEFLYGDQFEADFTSASLEPRGKKLKTEYRNKRLEKLRKIKLLRARRTLLKSTIPKPVKSESNVVKSEPLDKSLNESITSNESTLVNVKENNELDETFNSDLIDRQTLLARDHLKKNQNSLDLTNNNNEISNEKGIQSTNSTPNLVARLSSEPKRVRMDLNASSFMTNIIQFSELNESENMMKCAVCSDLASGTRYGVCVCEGCKEFFRRQRENPFSNKALRCVNGTNRCDINVDNRTHCRKCRLDKCVKLGMKLSTKFQNLYNEMRQQEAQNNSNFFEIKPLLPN